jgi:hypothetical protein
MLCAHSTAALHVSLAVVHRIPRIAAPWLLLTLITVPGLQPPRWCCLCLRSVRRWRAGSHRFPSVLCMQLHSFHARADFQLKLHCTVVGCAADAYR